MAYLQFEDYIVISITVVMSLGAGLLQSLRGKKDKTVSKYTMGNGKMAVLPVALSLLVSYQSGILMLGVPAEVYLYGMQINMIFLGNILGDLISVHLFIPRLSRLQMTCIFQYLEVRYDSRCIRLIGTVLSIISMGGFTAVIWTDVLQSVLMFGGIFAVLIKGTMDSGGLTKTWQTVYNQGRINFFVFDVDPTRRQTFWSLVVGGFASSLLKPFVQTTFLRIKATPNVRTRTRTYMLSAVLSVVMRLLVSLCGAITFAYYFNKRCDPLVSKQLDNPNQLLPSLVLDIFRDTPCLPGLFMAALFCASLSTISSVLSGMMSIFWEDIVKPFIKPVSDRRGICINQISGLAFGIIIIGVAFFVSTIEGPIIQGVIAGGAVSVVLVAWIMIGKMSSSGTRKNQTLEFAPIDSCPFYNVSAVTTDITSTSLYDADVTSTPFYDADVTIRQNAAIKEP
ncbi:sodium-coupled monocarboxylate transporter 1-like [Pecten maximus]|uniref:sodium-coupled monocarboxylate transporter 1-like n=1 Tax=Pecten maximus TaxID=6579 RepID=UPI001458D233|nr:sodium-coupled monocarboxylate transporter 1-like [Pecten maximus]